MNGKWIQSTQQGLTCAPFFCFQLKKVLYIHLVNTQFNFYFLVLNIRWVNGLKYSVRKIQNALCQKSTEVAFVWGRCKRFLLLKTVLFIHSVNNLICISLFQMFVGLIVWNKSNLDHIISLRGEVLSHTTSWTSPVFIEMYLPIKHKYQI